MQFVAVLVVTYCIFLGLSDPSAAIQDKSAAPQLRSLRTIKSEYVVNRLAWHPDNKTLAVGQNLNRKVTVWNAETGKVIRILEKEVGGVDALVYSPDGKYLAVGRNFVQAGKANVHLYSAQNGQLIHSFVPPSAAGQSGGNEAYALAFSPDGRYLATRGYGGGAAVAYDVVSGKFVAQLGKPGLVHSIAFSPDGKWVAVGRTDRVKSEGNVQLVSRIQLWSSSSWEVIREIPIVSANIIPFKFPALAFSPNSEIIASTIAPMFEGMRDSRTGKWVTALSVDRVKLWSVSTASQVNSFPSNQIGSIYSIRFSLDGTLLLVGGGNKFIEIWSVEPPTVLRTIEGFSEIVHFALNGSETRLATVSGNQIGILEFIDLNQDGISQSNELSTLAANNIASINTAATQH